MIENGESEKDIVRKNEKEARGDKDVARKTELERER